ncbi:hypothetical protein L1987_39111 [Smallanthus sonchifolius]|uniref:Uncharacterized protein n=1 Tax=Smallanthus sonchifolius TaxID=185202 RepID=A0ACB9HL34_9ASTR|nr:hypothetical protein L1987_39111 [Smallanthus sonchifolius]
MFAGYDFVPFDTGIPVCSRPFNNTFTFDSNEVNINILHSCNGLLLLRTDFDLQVYNPSLNLLRKLPCRPCFEIYEMSKGYSGWLVKYKVILEDITKLYPKTKRLSRKTMGFCSKVRCIVLGAREEDSFLVFETKCMVLQYKIVSKTLHLLHDLGSEAKKHERDNFQFIASFAGV